MIFFNYVNLMKEARGNHVKAISLLRDYISGRILDPSLKRRLTGYSFLLNPESLITAKCDILFKLQYLFLASKRVYTDYIQYGKKDLDLSMYPDIDIPKISTNPLIKISQGSIQFKYE